MTVNRLLPVSLVAALLLYGAAWQHLQRERHVFLRENYMDYTLPSRFTGPAAMEFKGMVSDFLFLKVITFLGERIGKQEEFNDQHFKYLEESVNTITDLDPYFWDAYLFADMIFTWDLKEYEVANKLLLKAREYRTSDYRVPYYLGFNYFFFLKDNINGSRYLMEASKLPGSPYYLASLAARLSGYALEHRMGIIFLKEMIMDTENEQIKREFILRIKTLEIMDQLEQKVREYKKTYRKLPSSLAELVTAGLIDRIPNDPYGGQFILLENGRVYTTSKMLRQK
ncbi:MAG: hypothetical protein AVO38_08475 [delta proteobacterium ML8_D]|nr:MAG: hypothetical protein AVO38_08475 [delta proteobacterium ML8_D]